MSLNFSLHSFPNSSLVFEVALHNDYGIYMYLEHNVDIRNKKERNFVDDFNEWILNKKIENLINNKKLNRELTNISLEDFEKSLKRKNDIGKIGEEIAYKYETY